jgi:hypothetical protein
MASFNFTDFYLGYPGHPRFRDKALIEDEVLRVIVQKWEMILFTNKGELFFDTEFGGDLPIYLHETKLSSDTIEADLRSQIGVYIPEIKGIDYVLKVTFFDHPERFEEMMEVYFQLRDLDVYLVVA